MDTLAVATIARNHDIEPIVHLSCRDRNRVALQSNLLGAAAIGVTSVVLSRGKKIPESLQGKVKDVFDARGSQLYEMALRIGSNFDELDATGFYTGSFVPVIKPPENWKAAKIQKKIADGVNFLQTRPCLNMETLRSYMRGLVRLKITHDVAIIVEIPVLTSADMASEIGELRPGTRIPNNLRQQIAKADDPTETGIGICADALSQLVSIPGVSGANILYGDDPDVVAAVIDRSTI